MIENLKTSCYRTGDIHDRKIIKDGKVVYRATAATNNLGVYVKGNKLYDNGRLVAVSAQEHPQIIQGDHLMFGEVRLDTDGVCINITLENYNKLYKREEVPGYKYFDPYDVYNIVDNVANGPLITYVRDGKTIIFGDPEDLETRIVWPYDTYVLYNNVIGINTYYTEDIEQTVMQYNAPCLSLRYFNPRIKVGDYIDIPIAIDDYFASYISKQTVTGPYTIELKIEDDDTRVVRKTIYAGESVITTPVFSDSNEVYGETWFSLRCIDSQGVAGPTHYLDVYIEDPNYEENIWELTDADLASLKTNDGIEIYYDDNYAHDSYTVQADPIYPRTPIDPGSEASQAEQDAYTAEAAAYNTNLATYQDFLLKAYKNKAGFTALFNKVINTVNSDSTSPGYSKNYNGVKLPKHRYCLTCYANKSTTPGTIDLGNDGINYYVIEVENVVDGNGNVVGNRLVSKTRRNVDQVKTDYDHIHRYQWYIDNWQNIEGAIEYDFIENAASGYEGDHSDDIIYDRSDSGPYFNYLLRTPTKKIPEILRAYGRCFYVHLVPNADSWEVGDTNVTKFAGTLFKAGKYYIRTENSPITGDHIVFPSNFILDLNGSIFQDVNMYDCGELNGSRNSIIPRYTSMLHLVQCTNTHIKNGTLHGGLDTCDMARAVSQSSMSNPYEHFRLFEISGCHFCSITTTNLCEYKGYGTNHNMDKDNRPNSRIPKSRGSGSATLDYGKYRGKRLDLIDGTLKEAYNDRDTFVASDSSIIYNSANITEESIGYIPLLDTRPECKYIFLGAGVNSFRSKVKREEVFVYFYNNNNSLLKVVKSKVSWLIRIPDGAVKIRIMGYWIASTSRELAVFQVKGTTGMVYKDLNIYNSKSCIFNGDQRQVLHDNIEFSYIASNAMVNRVSGEGCWSAITPHIFDIENSSVLGKYMTINNCRVTGGGVKSITFQYNGESIQITNNYNMTFNDWGGVQSALIKDNHFIVTGSASCINTRRGADLTFHPHIQYQNNTCEATLPANYTANNTVQCYDFRSHCTFNAADYDDEQDLVVPMRKMTLNKPAKSSTSKTFATFQNSKNGNEYID